MNAYWIGYLDEICPDQPSHRIYSVEAKSKKKGKTCDYISGWTDIFYESFSFFWNLVIILSTQSKYTHQISFRVLRNFRLSLLSS